MMDGPIVNKTTEVMEALDNSPGKFLSHNITTLYSTLLDLPFLLSLDFFGFLPPSLPPSLLSFLTFFLKK
jgi:hypothetical protein